MKKDISAGKAALSKPVAVILAVAIILLLVPVISFKSFTNNLVTDVSQTISEQYCQDLNSQMTTHIYDSLDDHFSHLEMMFDMLPCIDNISEEKLENYISQVQKDSGISYLAFADDEGYVYSANGRTLGTMSIKILGQLLNGETTAVSDRETVNGTSLIMLGRSFSEPVKMGDSNICIALYGLTSADLSTEIILNNEFSGGYSSIIHADGSFIVKNPLVPHGGLNVYEILTQSGEASEEAVAELRDAVNNNEPYMLSVTDEDGLISSYLYIAPIEGTDWYVVNTMPGTFIRTSIQEIQDKLSQITILLVALFAAAAAIIIFMQASASKKLRRSNEALGEALETAEIASASKTSFLFNMSHDIRTPMNAILGYTGIGLRHIDNSERVNDCLQKIRTAGGHLLNLINDILEMSCVESGKMEIVEAPLDIRAAITAVDHMSQSLASAKGIDYETVVEDIKNPYIYADELHVNEIIINLVSNAVKYTPEGGRVRYRINQISDVLDGKATFRFEISDNGIGMSDEFQRHLFETFSREQNTTVSKIEGTGLGLSIVKKILDLLGGDVRVKSKQKEGSTFLVEIPFRVMDEAAIETYRQENAAENEILEDISLDGARVLLVEDNEMNREIATDILTDAGLEVETAEDGELALKTVIEKGISYYDFILMDIQMPVMNGYEATKAIRALPNGSRVPIIALSANAFEEDVKKSKENGMDAHIAKPINIKALFETMHSFYK